MAILKKSQLTSSEPVSRAKSHAKTHATPKLIQADKTATALPRSTTTARQLPKLKDLEKPVASLSDPHFNPQLEAELAALKERYSAEVRQKIDADIAAYRESQFHQIEFEKQAILAKAQKEGYEAGKREADKIVTEKAQLFVTGMSDIAKEKNRILENSTEPVLDLAIDIAKRIVEEEIKLTPDLCIGLVKEALRKITDKDRVVIRVNEEDETLIRSQKDAILQLMNDIKQLEVQVDPKVDRGGCIIETKLGYIDARVSTKLEVIQLSLKQEYAEEKRERGLL
ncbi:MAG: FliH/SctL family protein [Candidatus Margulisiibacteriota bacterium]